jgi:hypothetical protein
MRAAAAGNSFPLAATWPWRALAAMIAKLKTFSTMAR